MLILSPKKNENTITFDGIKILKKNLKKTLKKDNTLNDYPNLYI